MKNKILGKEATDKVTGFKGIVTGHAEYLTGCSQYCLQPKVQKGAFIEARWFDEGKLEFSKKVIIEPLEIAGRENGCDMPAPKFG